jgi:hypothetical protein
MKPKSNRNASVRKMKRGEGFKLNLTLKLREKDKKLRKTHPKQLLAERLWRLTGNYKKRWRLSDVSTPKRKNSNGGE